MAKNAMGHTSDKEWADLVKELRGAWKDFPTIEDIRQEEVKNTESLADNEQDVSAYVCKKGDASL